MTSVAMRPGLRAHGHVPLRTVSWLSHHVSVSLPLGMMGQGRRVAGNQRIIQMSVPEQLLFYLQFPQTTWSP